MTYKSLTKYQTELRSFLKSVEHSCISIVQSFVLFTLLHPFLLCLKSLYRFGFRIIYIKLYIHMYINTYTHYTYTNICPISIWIYLSVIKHTEVPVTNFVLSSSLRLSVKQHLKTSNEVYLVSKIKENKDRFHWKN